MKAIIPCCGFGTRMEMAIDQSKEMLIEPSTGLPIIAYSIALCKKYGITPLVATRKEKTDLIEYCCNNNIQHIVIEPGKEWADTVLETKPYWEDKNVLLLPDVRFKPDIIIEQIKKSLDFGVDICYAVHEVNDISKWGSIDPHNYGEKINIRDPGYAWGIIGFTKCLGEYVFEDMTMTGFYHNHQHSDFVINFVFLDEFKDITRTGKIE